MFCKCVRIGVFPATSSTTGSAMLASAIAIFYLTAAHATKEEPTKESRGERKWLRPEGNDTAPRESKPPSAAVMSWVGKYFTRTSTSLTPGGTLISALPPSSRPNQARTGEIREVTLRVR